MVARLYSYELKTSSPKWPIRKGLLLQWNDGWGEIAPLPGFSSETLEEAEKEIRSLLPNLASAKPKLPSVRFALQSASCPLSFKPMKIPLALLNNPRPGFLTLKLKLGHLSITQAIKHVFKYIGFYRLRLDCNRAWSLDEALYFASHFSPADFEYLEEPLRSFPDLVRFSQSTGFPIAIDESFSAPYSQIPTLRAIVIKPTVIGALPSLSLPTVLSSAYESSLGLLLIARLQHNHFLSAGLDTFRFFEEDLLIPPLKAENGYLTWPGSSNCPIDFRRLSVGSRICAL